MNSTQKLIKNKMGLLNLAEELGNVSRTCKVMGYSRDTFYRYKELVDEGGIENLAEKTRRKSNVKNRIDEAVEDAVNQQEDGIILTEVQVAALEKKKDDDVACGEIETVHPGYLGSQNTFYVGCLKGVGRIYQQTFVDTYSKVAICKLYTTKTPILERRAQPNRNLSPLKSDPQTCG